MVVKRTGLPRAGLLSTRNWIRTPNGDQHHTFWCRRWLLHTDKDLDLAGIKTTDRWAMLAFDSADNVLAIIPGCEVIGYFPSNAPPPINAYCLGEN